MQNTDEHIIGKLPENLIMGLADFLVSGVGAKAYDGITYELLLGVSIEDKKKIQKYDKLRKGIENQQLNPDSILAKYKVANGFVYELDIKLARELTYVLAQMVAKDAHNPSLAGVDLVNEGPAKRRNADMVKLKNYIVNTAKKQVQAQMKAKIDAGKTVDRSDKVAKVTVALFSRNAVPVITYTVGDIKYNYQAYAIRPKDLVPINEHLIQKEGMRILNNIEICDILPSKTGVAVVIPVEVF